MNIRKLAYREIKNSPWQLFLFALCIVLSIASFIALEGFNKNVEFLVERDAKELVGGDIVVESNRAYTPELDAVLLELEQEYPLARTYEFGSIVYSETTNKSLFSQIKIVGNQYPLYGEVELASGTPFEDIPKQGVILVEPEALTSLNLSVGDTLQVGQAELLIADVIAKEPDRALTFFSLGPRILIFEDDLASLGLVGERSRVEYETYINVPEAEREEVSVTLENAAGERESVEIVSEESPGISNFIGVFLSFIKLILFFTILLAGIGMSTTLYTFLHGKRKSIAIMKAFGEKNKNVTWLYLFITILVGLLATLFGIILGTLLQLYLPNVFAAIIPEDFTLTLSWTVILRGVLLSLAIIIVFSMIPLRSLRLIKPLQILRDEDASMEAFRERLLFGLLMIVLLTIFVTLEFDQLLLGIVFSLSFFGLFALIYFSEWLALKLLRKLKPFISSLPLKLAISGLFRPGSKSLLFIATIATALTVIFTISLAELNVQEQFVTSYPENAPNVFFVDLKKDELEAFEASLGRDFTFYPVIRGPILSVNDKSIDELQEELGPGEPITREFSLTYYEDSNLLPTEKLIDAKEAGSMHLSTWDNERVAQVSVLTDISERMGLNIGDRLLFLIQGIELEAEVVSIRERTTNDVTPFFYFVFEKDVLFNAPQTVFTTATLELDEIEGIQTKVAREFPQVTTIDISKTAQRVGEVLSELSAIVQFFTLFSLIAGFLILVSSLVATSRIRLREIIYFKLVGAKRSLILKTVLYEYILIGLLASLVGIILSTGVTYALLTFFLELDFVFLFVESLLFILITTIIIVVIGLLGTLNLLRKKPIEYIRKHASE